MKRYILIAAIMLLIGVTVVVTFNNTESKSTNNHTTAEPRKVKTLSPEIVDSIVKRAESESLSIRRKAVSEIEKYFMGASIDPKSRQILAKVLGTRLTDGTPPSITQPLERRMKFFGKECLTEDLKASIAQAATHRLNTHHILVAGIVDIKSINKIIETLEFNPSLENPPSYYSFPKLNRAAALVRARRGDKDSIKKILLTAENTEEYELVVFLFQELEYVKQPEIILFLQKYLNDDESRIPSPTVGQPGNRYANRAATSLKRMLVGFPDQYDFCYSDQDIEVCRKWMNEQTEWKFKDKWERH